MAGLWTERHTGREAQQRGQSYLAALTQALFNTSLRPSSDQHQPSYKPAYCVIHPKKLIEEKKRKKKMHKHWKD